MSAPLQIGDRATLQAVVVGAVIADICEALIASGTLADPERMTCAACGCLAHPHELCPGCRALVASSARREVVRELTDCCRCCEAAVERGEDIGHDPGPGRCPHPRCDYCQGEA